MGLLGVHVSIAGGVENAPARGRELGCDAIQIFSKNQRRWKSDPLSDDAAMEFRRSVDDCKIKKVVVHDSYLINLAHPDPDASEKSMDAFSDEMKRADMLGVAYLVFHPGTHLKTTEAEGVRRIAESLNVVQRNLPESHVMLLLETTAGQGNHLGYRFEQLAEIISLTEQKEKVGVCYDTAHSFAAGYDLRTEKTYEETFTEFDGIVGLNKLKVFHLNDSKGDVGSRIDRHDNIGKGFLGMEPFRFLVNDSRFQKHPMILETPGGDKHYKENLNLLRSLMD
jgi:deoxyribonuclease-4